MQSFDIEQLKTLVAVVEAGSLTAAAPLVFLSQSAVSEQMRKLEERVGQPLLTRSKAGVAPTPAGHRLVGHARRILALSDEAFRDLRGQSLQGELRLAVTDYFRPGDLARLLSRLGEGYPQVRLNVSVLKSGAIEAGYARGDFDVGLSMRIVGVRAEEKAEDVARSAVLRRESLAWMGAEGGRGLRGEPLRLVVLPDTCSLHQFTIKLLQQRRVPFTVAHVASGVAGLQSALAAGLGVACLNESALCEGVARLVPPHGLPALPRVAFHFLPARRGETEFVTRARDLISSQLV
jgi:DNA-binding transcriptional LysR family regulator